MRVSAVSDDDGAVDEGGLVGRHEHDQGYDVVLTGAHSSERDGSLGVSVVLQRDNGVVVKRVLRVLTALCNISMWLVCTCKTFVPFAQAYHTVGIACTEVC